MKTQSHFLLVHQVNKEDNDPTPRPRVINTVHVREIVPIRKMHPLGIRCRITFDYLSVNETPAHIFVTDGFDSLTVQTYWPVPFCR